MDLELSGIPQTLGPSGPSLCSRAQNSIQDSLNESSVRPNGTPVMPILHSKFGTRGRPQREDLDLAASAGRFAFGGLSGKIWIWRPQREDLDLAARGIIITTTNVSGGTSRRGKSFVYYSALIIAGTKKRRPKT